MFAKRSKSSPAPQRPSGDGSQTEPSGPDPRDATIARLSRELAAERDNLTTLREALDAATFKIEVLEKSYAKQLADARQRLAATERALAEKGAVLGALDGGHEDALRALNAAREENRSLLAERDELRKRIAQGGFRDRSAEATRAPLAHRGDTADDSGSTINELIKDAAWAPKTPTPGSGHANAKVAEQDAPLEVMISPDLVFTKDGDDEDDER